MTYGTRKTDLTWNHSKPWFVTKDGYMVGRGFATEGGAQKDIKRRIKQAAADAKEQAAHRASIGWVGA